MGGIILPDADAGAHSFAWVRLPCRVLLRRLWPPVRVWVAAPLGLGRVLGLRLAWVRISGWVLLRRLWPPGRVWVAVPLEFGLGAWACDWRGCVEDTPDIDVRFPS